MGQDNIIRIDVDGIKSEEQLRIIKVLMENKISFEWDDSDNY